MSKRLLSLMLAASGLFSPDAPLLLAQGTIYTSLPQPQMIFSDLLMVQYPIDINGDSIVDFTFAADTSGVGLRTERTNRVVIRPDPPPNIGGLVARVEGGDQVGSSLSPQWVWISSQPVRGYVLPDEIAFATIVQCLSSGCASDWPGGPATRAFIGLEFELSDGLHYGYFDIFMRGDIPGAQLYGWAYNSTPGQPITAFGIPEPSALALVTVAGIAMLVLRARKEMSNL